MVGILFPNFSCDADEEVVVARRAKEEGKLY